jgi:hypothetical protein
VRIPVERIFAKDYSEAREKFLNAAAITKAEHRAFAYDVAGPQGERLTTDVVWLGDPDRPNVLVLMSGTHGVELYCGSACMIDIFLHGRLPRDWAICCIHAVNPWGAAWGRRENEDNIDLNRNYVDFDADLPRNDLYRDIHADLLLKDLGDAALAASIEAIAKAPGKHGARAVLTARSAGQYEFPDGLHYGGSRPAASRQIVEEVIRQYDLPGRANVVVWDYHTGAGPFGYCEPIYLGTPDGERYRLAKRLFGPWLTEQRTDKAVTPPQTGLGSELWERLCGPRVYFIGLEFGTYPMTPSGGILREDSFLHRQPGKLDWSSAPTRRVKNALREEYDPQSAIWRELVLGQNRITYALFLENIRQTARICS